MLSCQEICEKDSLIRYQLYKGLQKLIVSADRRSLKFWYNYFQNIRDSMISKRRMEDSESWRAVGRIEEEESITDVSLSFGVYHSVISHLWKQFQTSQTLVRRPVAGRPGVTIPAED